MNEIRNIVIVGGGTSGWMAAAYLSRRLGTSRGGTQITLIESTDIPTIGVGEATIPPMRLAVLALGLDEAEFMRETSATFKLAIKLDDWLYLPENEGDPRHSYYHTFGQFGTAGTDPMTPYWVMDREEGGLSFVDYTMMEGRMCDMGLAPKRADDPPFRGPVEYAYHFDAGQLVELMKKVGIKHGVKHLIGNVTKTNLAEDGAISSLDTKEHGALEADLYIDCTGFGAHLIEKAMGSEFTPLNDVLFCDAAVACQVPYDDPNTPIDPFTTSTAQPHGWTWDIGLNNRRGTGYVYATEHIDADGAEAHLRDYIGPAADDLTCRHLKMRVGHRKQHWVKNCVAVGLSAGFVEPLESTGIYFSDIALRWIADFLVPGQAMELAAASYNARMIETYEDVIDFVKMHYCLSRRTDTEFWIENQREATIPQTLLDRLEEWRHRIPGVFEFPGLPKVFGLTNYTQVLYGMEHLPDLTGQEARYANLGLARQQTQMFAQGAERGRQMLPAHRALVEEVYRNGFRPRQR